MKLKEFQEFSDDYLIFLNGRLLLPGDYEIDKGIPYIHCLTYPQDVVQMVWYSGEKMQARIFRVESETILPDTDDVAADLYLENIGLKFDTESESDILITTRGKVTIQGDEIVVKGKLVVGSCQ